jgi:hypothetical protein
VTSVMQHMICQRTELAGARVCAAVGAICCSALILPVDCATEAREYTGNLLLRRLSLEENSAT